MTFLMPAQTALRHTIRWLLITLIAALLVLMTTQIVMRYGFNSSLLWAEEMCRYMLIWLSFLGIALAYERGEVAALSFLSLTLPRVPALVLGAACALLSLVLCALLVWYGLKFADLAGSSKIPALRFILEDLFGENAPDAPVIYWVYVALPLGMALVGLRLIGDILMCLRAIPTGQSLAEVLSNTDPSVAP